MSDTDIQEDLSVEVILSSIKNILVDEEGNNTENKQEEDVLNLDNSMVVDSTASSQNIESILDSITEPVVEEKPKEKTSASLADSIDIEQTLKEAAQIDLNNIPILDNIIEKDIPTNDSSSAVKEETIDASANIINNFAKVFAEKQHAQQNINTASAITTDISQNIEGMGISQMIKETIIQQVKLSLDSHFEQIASSIITEQTQQWLNNNLASIVEKTVAKEIERVIAKVGS